MFVWKLTVILLNICSVLCVRNPNEIEYVEMSTHRPTLEELKSVLENALKKNFDFVSVEVVDSPNLTEEPFNLASPGISGDPLIFEYGNDDYLLPLVDRTKVYDLIPIVRRISSYNEKTFFACGAGAGPFDWLQQNSEGIYNLMVHQNGSVTNENHVVRTVGDGIEVLRVPNNETRAALLGNIFLTEGNAGKVLKVVSRNRTGPENFISAMRKGLTDYYTDEQVVGLGGAFVMKTGSAFVHVMDEFSETPIHTTQELNNWLTFHEIQGPLIALGDFVSQETDFKLRLQHFHCYSKHNHGGHYHYDTTRDIVEYEGYFNVVNRIIIVDKNAASEATSIAALFSMTTVAISIFSTALFN
ncbi:hypothetical protein HA402_013043 [Bradysia odoriphaga]|nr:hypothetical protein HA402_013043 [Bradysia odoriphaga]